MSFGKDIKAVYFIGAGGIGMSALVRYFISHGMVVAGYDKTSSELTVQLEKEGALLHYEENVDMIPHACRDAQSTTAEGNVAELLDEQAAGGCWRHPVAVDYQGSEV